MMQHAVKAKVRGLRRNGASLMVTSRELGKTRLPLWAAAFVVLICAAILGLSGWREWETRNTELDGTGPDTIAKLQAYLPTRKSSDRIRGIFVYDETGRWLATTEQVDFSKF